MTVQTIPGILGIQDSERTFVEGVGQRQVFDATQEYVAMVNEDLARVTALFIDRTTEDHKFRYYLPADGEMQRVSDLGRPGERKITGSWDVALPLEAFGDALGTSRIDLAYMTLADYQRHVEGIALRASNTLRKEILRTLFDNVNYNFVDPLRGTLGIKALANTDGTLYPPVAGGTTAADATHYVESAYATASITDTNNPIKTISRALRARFSANGTARRRVILVASGAQDYLEALTDFEQADDVNLQRGANANSVLNIPGAIPGEIIGYCNEAYVAVWDWMPANYMIGIDLQADKPIQMRVDPGYTNLPRGLTLVTESDVFPLTKSDWQWRFGLGVVNRLNGFIMELGIGGSYSIPSGYSH
jgi:hypothetical protein